MHLPMLIHAQERSKLGLSRQYQARGNNLCLDHSSGIWRLVSAFHAGGHHRAALGYRTRGRDAATFQIGLSQIQASPGRAPRGVFAAGFGFGGVALARRRRRGLR
jgi:hypothetical protein